MARDSLASPSRRAFLRTTASAAGGLVIGCHLPLRRASAQSPGAVAPNAFVRVGADDVVTVLLKHAEMGQGVWTSMPMVVAEELGCDLARVRVEHAPAAPEYAHTTFGLQMTGGSTSTSESFDQLRTAGAMARTLLVQAAAQRWNVAPAQCRVENGVIVHGAARLSFGAVANAAAKLPAPASVPLKPPSAWTLIGRPTRRLDSPLKVSGRARYGLDVQLPGMVTAVVARPPVFGATLKSYDALQARNVPGVLDVIPVPSGVAVIAAHFWAAKKGRDALQVAWDLGAGADLSSDALQAHYRTRAATPGVVAAQAGDVEAALRSGRVIEAEYLVPFLAHATMEPENCTVQIGADGCDIYTGTQFQTEDQRLSAQILGLPPEKVRIHTQFLGGGFGRRAPPNSDYVTEAVHVAKAAGRTVKVVWTREDDVRCGYYRPMWLSRLRAALRPDGVPAAWAHTIVGQSVAAAMPEPLHSMLVKNGVDESSVQGAADSPYLKRIAAHRVDLHTMRSPITVASWRSVGHSHTGFVVESFIDELAHAAGQDPVAYRRALLPADARERRALDLAAERFGWGRPLPEGHAAGVAVHASFGSYVAEIAEVSIEARAIRVHRVVCAIDCGPVVNPLTVEAQMQSGIVYGLSAALFGEITIRDGRAVQGNFNDYRVLRLTDMPQVEVHIVPSTDKMGGCGEPGTPPIAAAVANAVFAASGTRLRTLPLKLA